MVFARFTNFCFIAASVSYFESNNFLCSSLIVRNEIHTEFLDQAVFPACSPPGLFISKLRGGSISADGEPEFSLGEVESSGKEKAEKFTDDLELSKSAYAEGKHLSPTPIEDSSARVIDCRFSHDGDKNGVFYYLGNTE